MSHQSRSLLFSLVAFLVIVIPQVTLAAICWSVDSNGNWSVSISTGPTCDINAFTPYGLPGGSIVGIVSTVVGWLLTLLGIFGILGFVVSGIMYLVSAGNDDLIKKAKSGLLYSIVGIIVGLSGYVIMLAVNGLLRGTGGDY